MRTSESITEISAALAKALPAVQNATKDASNPAYRSTYATLNAVMEAVKPTLFEHGIVVVQGPGWRDGIVTVTTRFLHASGEWIETEAGAPVAHRFEKVDGVMTDKGPDAQTAGSAISYLRRYSLAAMAGITQEDDDGNAASGTHTNGSAARSGPPDVPLPSKGSGLQCPACGKSDMWDNRVGKKNPRGPDLKCKDKGCDHAIWLKDYPDQLIEDLHELHGEGRCDAEERDKATKAVGSGDIDKILTVAAWIVERKARPVEAVPA